MAVGLIDGAAGPAQYTDERVTDPRVVSLCDRITATLDTNMAEDATSVTLTLKDGSSYTETVTHATGAPENPMSDAKLNEKFWTLAGDCLPKKRVGGLLEMLWDLDRIPNIGQAIALTRMRSRKVRT